MIKFEKNSGTHNFTTKIGDAVKKFLDEIFDNHIHLRDNSPVFASNKNKFNDFFLKINAVDENNTVCVKVCGKGGCLGNSYRPLDNVRSVYLTNDNPNFNPNNNANPNFYVAGQDIYNWDNNTIHIPNKNLRISFRWLVIKYLQSGQKF
jgi:hypothetical protein